MNIRLKKMKQMQRNATRQMRTGREEESTETQTDISKGTDDGLRHKQNCYKEEIHERKKKRQKIDRNRKKMPQKLKKDLKKKRRARQTDNRN